MDGSGGYSGVLIQGVRVFTFEDWSTWWAFDGLDTIAMVQSVVQRLPLKTITSCVLFSYGHGCVRGVQGDDDFILHTSNPPLHYYGKHLWADEAMKQTTSYNTRSEPFLCLQQSPPH